MKTKFETLYVFLFLSALIFSQIQMTAQAAKSEQKSANADAKLVADADNANETKSVKTKSTETQAESSVQKLDRDESKEAQNKTANEARKTTDKSKNNTTNSNKEKNAKRKRNPKTSGNKSDAIDISTMIAVGEVSTEIMIPQIESGVLKSIILADVMRGISKHRVQFETMILQLYNKKGDVDMIIHMPTAIYDAQSKILASPSKTIIQKPNTFILVGDSMAYHLGESIGRMDGEVRMIVDSLSQENESDAEQEGDEENLTAEQAKS